MAADPNPRTWRRSFAGSSTKMRHTSSDHRRKSSAPSWTYELRLPEMFIPILRDDPRFSVYTASNSTVSNLPGPGRTLDRLISYLGRRLEARIAGFHWRLQKSRDGRAQARARKESKKSSEQVSNEKTRMQLDKPDRALSRQAVTSSDKGHPGASPSPGDGRTPENPNGRRISLAGTDSDLPLYYPTPEQADITNPFLSVYPISPVPSTSRFSSYIHHRYNQSCPELPLLDSTVNNTPPRHALLDGGSEVLSDLMRVESAGVQALSRRGKNVNIPSGRRQAYAYLIPNIHNLSGPARS